MRNYEIISENCGQLDFFCYVMRINNSYNSVYLILFSTSIRVNVKSIIKHEILIVNKDVICILTSKSIC